MFNFQKTKNIICLIIILIMLLSAVVEPTNQFYVNDYAGVLTEETKNYIVQTNVELQQKTRAQIVVVTVSSLENQSIEEYATELFRKFGIGDSEQNNGVLLLCSTGDRLFRIEVGYGLEGALPDGKTGRIQDEYIIPYLKNDNYDEGIKNGFNAILSEITSEYGINITLQKDAEKIQNSSTLSLEESKIIAFVVALIMTIVLSVIIGCILRGKSMKFKSILLLIYACFLIWFIHYMSYNAEGVEEINVVRRIIILLFNGIVLLIFTLLKPRSKKNRKSSSWFNNDFWNNDSFGGDSSFGGGGSSGGGGSTRSF